MSRLSIEITPKEHQQIKAMAALQGKTIKDLVMERLFSKPSDDDTDWLEFTAFLKDRIDKAMTSPPSPMSLDDIAQDVIQRKSS